MTDTTERGPAVTPQAAPSAAARRSYHVTDEPRQRVELLHHNIRRHGTIFNTLAAVCEVTGVIVAEPTGSG